MTAAETLRAREVYRYYQPRSLLEPLGTPQSEVDTDGSSIHQATNFNTQQSFSDTALTAFTQLIALRLESQRAIVSLIDHENEYFLAESTSTFSLIGDDGPSQNAWLSISGARVPRTSSLCEQTLSLVPNQDSTAEMTPVYLVPDLRLDEKMNTLDCVKGSPYLRFYCGVALRNKEGINIGCVYVVDDRPRSEVSLEQAQFLTRMAATVMDHLENIRAKEDVVRVTRMSQALHAFIEGDGTMKGDWQQLKRYNLPSGGGAFRWEISGKPTPAAAVPDKNKSSGLTRNLPSFTGSDYSMSQGKSPLQHTEKDNSTSYNNSPWSSTVDIQRVPTLKSVFEVVEDAAIQLEAIKDPEFENDGFSHLLRKTFSRASNLLKEGMEVDGAVFFDAPFRFYQGRSTLESDPRREEAQDHSSSDSEDDQPKPRPGPRPRASAKPKTKKATKFPDTLNPEESNDMPPPAYQSEILGFSTLSSSSLDKHTSEATGGFKAIDQSLLTALVRRYPLGELFVFDKDGPISPLGDTQVELQGALPSVREARQARQKSRIRREILRLLKSFPGARQIFFAPLYDSTSGCFIGSFVWSNSATRMFSTENHLSYVIAFGHSVMTEVSRLNTLSADRAKGEFINNVSHELRSPLHGILASVEFLADTSLDGFQRNLVNTVDICGRTLLDTIEHVLDFTKIKKFGQESSQPMGAVADLDISAIIEEVLEAVYAGFEFNGLSSMGLADTTKSTPSSNAKSEPNPPGVSSDEPISVILDIDFEQWTFPTVPGFWRRLTMNIFGNALKYTRAGSIKIRLEARNISPLNSNVKNDGIERTLVTLTITDTGHGMSEDFLKTKLFQPFSQEDVTAPGTGLGMSIVKQIVDLAGGRINVQSEQGKGTSVVLSVPLENCVPSSTSVTKESLPEKEDAIEAVRRRAAGRKVTIRGFNNPQMPNVSSGPISSLRASLEKIVTDWFKLTVVSDDESADIVICDEPTFRSTSITENEFEALLILCSNSARRGMYTSELQAGQTVEFVSKPCGPHRLATALLNCLDSEDAMVKASTTSVSFDGSRSAAVPVKSIVGRSKSLRLIGDLQSSIGFSPNVAAKVYPSMPLHRELEMLDVVAESSEGQSGNEHPGTDSTMHDPSSSNTIESTTVERDESFATDMVDPEATPKPISRPKMLLVEDNPINMTLLSMYMKKNNWEFEMATNGLLALQAFQMRPDGFDVIFMDVSMPVMTGYEATRLIRATEHERRLAYEQQQTNTKSPSEFGAPSPSFPFNFPQLTSSTQPQTPAITYSAPHTSSASITPSAFSPIDVGAQLSQQPITLPTDIEGKLKQNKPALIIALTGFSGAKDREMAFESGVDVFMTKPVRFREVGRILAEFMGKIGGEKVEGGRNEVVEMERKRGGRR